MWNLLLSHVYFVMHNMLVPANVSQINTYLTGKHKTLPLIGKLSQKSLQILGLLIKFMDAFLEEGLSLPLKSPLDFRVQGFGSFFHGYSSSLQTYLFYL